MMMMHRIKNGLSVLRLSFPQKQGFVPSKPLLAVERLVLYSSDVGGGGVCSPSSAAAMGSRRLLFFHAGGGGGGGGGKGAFLVKREPTKTKEEECQTISSSKLIQRETTDDEISNSTKVSLNQFPGLMAPHGFLSLAAKTCSDFVRKCSSRRLLRLNPVTGYFEEQQDAAAAAATTLQVPYGHICRGSAYGWLFLTDGDNLDMKLFNPFSGAEIQLPPVKNLPPSTLDVEDRWPLSEWFVHKAVFSANPSFEPRPVVLVIYGGQPITRLAFCKPGDERWTPLEFSSTRANVLPHSLQRLAPLEIHFHFHWDAIYHKGQFYVLTYPGYVAAFDIGRLVDDDDHSVKTTLIATPPSKRRGKIKVRLSYLVVVDGELVKVELRRRCLRNCCIKRSIKKIVIERNRDGDTSDEEEEEEEDYSSGDDEEEGGGDDEDYSESDDDDDDDDADGGEVKLPFPHWRLTPSTYGVKIRRLDVKSEKQWVKVESLGDKAVFVGYNTSFALSASDYPAGVCIPDSIYFTYGYGGNKFTERSNYDEGIYNLKDESWKPLYPPTPLNIGVIRPAPIWIVNALSSCSARRSDGKIDR